MSTHSVKSSPFSREHSTRALLALIAIVALQPGCSAANKSMSARADLRPLLSPADAPAAALARSHFQRDRSGSISEEDLQRVLAAPVYLEADARVGVVQVRERYQTDQELPLSGVPAQLTTALQDAGLFDVATEVSAEWPADSGIGGLRELAARYRAEYLLLYRHRFVDEAYLNAWGWAYLSVVGVFFVPAETVQAAGVMEATLFDVRTGTILYTVFERVRGDVDANVWNTDRKRSALKEGLLHKASERLCEKVVSKARVLAAARPAPASAPSQALGQALPPSSDRDSADAEPGPASPLPPAAPATGGQG